MTKWIGSKRQHQSFVALTIMASVYAFIFSRTNRIIIMISSVPDRYTEDSRDDATVPQRSNISLSEDRPRRTVEEPAPASEPEPEPEPEFDALNNDTGTLNEDMDNITGSLNTWEVPPERIVDEPNRNMSNVDNLDDNYTDGTVVSSWDNTQYSEDEHSNNRYSSKIEVEGTVVVVTGKYGHNDMFKDEVEETCARIRELSYFDPNHVFCYYQSPDYVLQDERFLRHLQYKIDPNDASARGGGYWCHKSLVLRHMMREYKDGDYFVYMDADRTDFGQQGHIHNIIETMAKRDADLAIELQIGFTEIIYTKQDMLNAFNASDEMRHSEQVAANGFVIRNSPKMRKLMDVWADCVSDYHMVSDEASILPNSEFFLTHIHDQSILGLLVKTFMTRQAMVGPPTVTFRDIDAYYTWQLDDIDALHCPFSDYYSVAEPNRNMSNVVTFDHNNTAGTVISRWDYMQYDSGHFAVTLEEGALRPNCISVNSGLGYDQLSAVDFMYQFCYCFRRYPDFILDDERWSSHVRHLGPAHDDDGGQIPVYWFCAKPRPNPQIDWSKIEVEGTVVVVTGKYGHNDMFKDEVEETCARIRELSYFDPNHVFCHYQSPDYVLQDERFVRHLQYRIDPNDASARGGGYWCHKSLVLRNIMREYKDGDYFVYIDADRIDFLQQGHIHNIIETMAKRDADLAIELQTGCSEIIYTKKDVLHAFNASDEMLESEQVAANGFVIRNSSKMRKLMDVWADCVSNYHMVSDEASILPNSEFFWLHVHDQSILGLLVKTFMTRQAMVGPPTVTFRDVSAYHTWQLDDIDALHCPFPDYYSVAEPNRNMSNVVTFDDNYTEGIN